MIYSIGQERLAKAVVNKFREKGFFVILYKPSSSSINPKFIAEHKLDTMAYTDEKCYQEDLKAYKNTMFNLIQEEGQICGYVKIAQFGKKLEQVASSSFAFKPEEKILNAYLEMYNEKRRLEASIIKPDTISFCSITFPEKNIGLDFEEIFESFCQINLQDSYPFEQVQKVIIDELDKCQFLHIEGRKNNKTNLTIKLPELKNPQKETLFLNCGGDLNVPYGELFTTPELKGTRGKLYIEKIYLNNVPYEKLELDFEDGKIVKSTCKNFENEKENEEYVKQELLQGKKDVTIGEAAIGTNTLAYSVSRKYDILFRMPILLLEKMGPHIAVGDPCFARGEKSSVFDLYTSKEMIARYNEETKKGNYLNFHTDITLPYGEIKKLYGETKTGEKILIMKNGLFVLKGTKLLNENLNLTKEDK
ncbi:MAG: aminopeptidase [Sphaerochaetaceae bacterium]|nr:aminopeptidase [Sphaerochaetaceae bacterium]